MSHFVNRMTLAVTLACVSSIPAVAQPTPDSGSAAAAAVKRAVTRLNLIISGPIAEGEHGALGCAAYCCAAR